VWLTDYDKRGWLLTAGPYKDDGIAGWVYSPSVGPSRGVPFFHLAEPLGLIASVTASAPQAFSIHTRMSQHLMFDWALHLYLPKGNWFVDAHVPLYNAGPDPIAASAELYVEPAAGVASGGTTIQGARDGVPVDDGGAGAASLDLSGAVSLAAESALTLTAQCHSLDVTTIGARLTALSLSTAVDSVWPPFEGAVARPVTTQSGSRSRQRATAAASPALARSDPPVPE
jgi:hypothetical protein